MKSWAWQLFGGSLALCAGLVTPSAHAVGTLSGSTISNVASLHFTQSGNTLSIQSNAAQLRVDEILNVVVHGNDANNVTVASPDTHRVLIFTVTNTGNGPQPFRLAPNTSLPGDQFDPIVYKVALDSNGNHVYDPASDADYTPGSNDPLLLPDQSITVFVLCDIPATRQNGDLGIVALNASAVAGTGNPGTVFAGHGAGGSDLVVGTSRGTAVAQEAYAVARLQVQLVKSQVVSNTSGSTTPSSGSVVTYTLQLDLGGNGNAINGVISDPLPANTSYVPGSLHLDGLALTDQSDADAGRFTGSAIEVRLGALTAPASHLVTFQVRLN